MARATLMYRGKGAPGDDAARIAATAGVHVIDREFAQAMLIEADDATLEKLRQQFPDWLMAPELSYPKPGTE